MAVIGKIREKSTLMLIIIGGALIAFVLGDLLTSGSSLFGGPQAVGEIGDVEISGVEFNNRVEQKVNEFQIQNNTTANEEVRASIREQVWNELMDDHILGSQFKELGVVVTPEELFDMVQGNDPHPQVKQAFTNPQTGAFNSADVIRFLKNMENDQNGQTKMQ